MSAIDITSLNPTLRKLVEQYQIYHNPGVLQTDYAFMKCLEYFESFFNSIAYEYCSLYGGNSSYYHVPSTLTLIRSEIISRKLLNETL